ncbi:alpha/beta hydrolase [Brevundimonas sp. Root1279]|uniref:alpha/beta hydrolase n=1 Tax=Brevundimonas sp. Root1279 TaxID=1736443 RepID=UPI0006F3F610|nr:alpha/beta hydrolase-fold protein [Brevundimonas sp. Root1279]KQW78913.1 esterase [Brevundimonas sp. Root1279]
MRRLAVAAGVALTLAGASPALAQSAPAETPIVIGQSYALPSALYGGTREINVWLPPGYADSGKTYPVLYVLDGGQDQDFHHISGIAQLGTVVGTTRDVIVVGVASKDRRNELALPTEDPELIARYPSQGQSARFRDFLWKEVEPFVEGRFRTSGETALMGESLAGLFVVETFLKEPQMFDAYVAVSPSLWWDGGRLARQAGAHLRDHSNDPRTVILTMGEEGPEAAALMDTLTSNLRDHALPGVTWSYEPRPLERHSTIYHGAALDAFRSLYATPLEP